MVFRSTHLRHSFIYCTSLLSYKWELLAVNNSQCYNRHMSSTGVQYKNKNKNKNKNVYFQQVQYYTIHDILYG